MLDALQGVHDLVGLAHAHWVFHVLFGIVHYVLMRRIYHSVDLETLPPARPLALPENLDFGPKVPINFRCLVPHYLL